MRKGSAHLIVVLLVALIIICGLVYYALFMGKKATAPVATSTPTAVLPVKDGYRRVAMEEVTIDVPAGWQETIDDPSETVRTYKEYDAVTGDYVSLTIGGGGRSNPSDASWAYRLSDTRPKSLILVKEDEVLCAESEPLCIVGDGQLDIGVKIDNDGMIGIIAGNLYSLYIGNSKNEAASRQLYRDILSTVRVQ
jgi:hypothetical protein